MKSVILNTDQVRNVLAGDVVRFSRPVKPQPQGSLIQSSDNLFNWYDCVTVSVGDYGGPPYEGQEVDVYRAPYKVGDVIKVKLPIKETCPCCGYTYRDKKIQMDHYICEVNRITLKITDVKCEKNDDGVWVFNYGAEKVRG